MNGVLVDTSVWVDHFRARNAGLVELLGMDLVLIHPLIVGEIACGTPPARAQTLADLANLQPANQATVTETMAFIEQERLFGLGCGLVDLQLLASTLLTPGARLWTLDKRLDALAHRLGAAYQPRIH